MKRQEQTPNKLKITYKILLNTLYETLYHLSDLIFLRRFRHKSHKRKRIHDDWRLQYNELKPLDKVRDFWT